MARKPSLRTFAETVGHISIQWNWLERHVNAYAYHYLGGDSDVASRILSEFGNVTKTEFIKFLLRKNEGDERLVDHGHHVLIGFDLLRQNRNIIEHSVPGGTREGKYKGLIAKANKIGVLTPFELPIEDLKKQLSLIKHYRHYTIFVHAAAASDVDDGLIPTTREAMITALSKPPRPSQLVPLPPEGDPPTR